MGEFRVCMRFRDRPAGFDPSRISHAPTVRAVLEMCGRLPWSSTTKSKAEEYLPYFLEGKLYTEGGANIHLHQFVGGSDPYKYYGYCQSIERDFPRTKACGGWLKSVARLLVCWVAEELTRCGIGGGFYDHFKVTRRAAPVSDAPSDTYGAALIEYYETSMEQSEATPAVPLDAPPQSIMQQSETAAPVPLDACHGRKLTPPSYDVQMHRTCPLVQPLKRFLKSGGGTKRKCVDYTRMEGKVVFDQIKLWMHTEEGRSHARLADIDPDGFEVDHVICEKNGGPTHLHNAHLMPSKHNHHFRDLWTYEKRAYVGEEAVQCARRLARWANGRVDWFSFSCD